MLTEFPGIPGHVTTLSLQLLQKGTCPTYFFLSFFFIFRGGGGGGGFGRKIKIARWTFADRRGVQTILTLCTGLVELFKGNSRDLLGQKHSEFF